RGDFAEAGGPDGPQDHCGQGPDREYRGRLMRAAVLAPLVLALSATALSGCAGFQPLYAEQNVVGNLAAIDVVAPEGRTGYLIRQHLDDRFAKNHSAAAAYRMNLNL